MTDEKRTSIKFRIAVFITSFFILIFLAIFIYLKINADITAEELGPSPFQIDDTFASENNDEYLAIAEIGKSIIGYDEINEEFELNLRDPQSSILMLEEFLKKNEGIIEKLDIRLFQNCKFPKPKIDDPTRENLRDLLGLIQKRALYYILTKNFVSAKQDMLLLNTINQELMNKSTSVIFGLIWLLCKNNELKNIKLLINANYFTIEQKIEILNIAQPKITSQFIKPIAHFEIEYFHWSMQELSKNNSSQEHMFSDAPYYPILTPFYCQPNKSAKLYREMMLEILLQVDASDYIAYQKLNYNTKFNPNYRHLVLANFGGKLSIVMTKPVIQLFAGKLLSYNNMCQQLTVAHKLLLHKSTVGFLPNSLEELNLEKKLYTDIYTGDSFLYSSQNGVLQSVGKDKTSSNIELFETALTTEQIETIIADDLKDFTLYLK